MISVVINTLNEEKNLPAALDSVKGFADEIVVVDMYSDDDTLVIAKKAGAKVYEHKRTGYVEPARNFAIEKATGDWILVLDADEIISPSLSSSLKEITRNPKADYYRIPRKNIIFGKWIKHCLWWPDYNIRFFRKGYVSWNEIIHSIPVTQGSGADLESKEENAIVHYNYKTIEQYVERLNRYTSHQSTVLRDGGYEFVWSDIIKEPLREFVSRYFEGQGFKDGVHGLALSILQAFSEFVLYLKIWQEGEFKSEHVSVSEVSTEIRRSQKEINYWVADTLFKEKGYFLQRVRRKLKI